MGRGKNIVCSERELENVKKEGISFPLALVLKMEKREKRRSSPFLSLLLPLRSHLLGPLFRSDLERKKKEEEKELFLG